MKLSLYDIGKEWEELEDALLESGGELTPELEERLGELMTAETNKINGYLAVRANLKMLAEGADAEAKRLTAKKKAAEASIKRMEERLLAHLEARGEKEVVADLGKVRVMEASTAPVLLRENVNPQLIDERYRKVTYSVDTAAIKADLTGDDEDAKAKALFFAELGERTRYLRVW